MRTVLLLGPDLRGVGGVSTHLNQLLSSNVTQHFRLLYFQVGSEGRSETTREMVSRFLRSLWQLMAFLRKHRPSIVHINTSMHPRGFWRDLGYLLVSRVCRCKVVYQVHGGSLPSEFTGGSAFLNQVLRATLRMPNLIVLLGEFQRRAYQAFLHDLPLRVAANAIDTEGFAPPLEKGVPPGQPLRLVYVGRLAKPKGIFEAAEAVALLRDQGIHVYLSIAGRGPEERRLRQRVAELNVADRVTFRGVLFGKEKNELWLASDAFVLPSHREALPYALLESMAACTIPVACPVGAIPEVMENQRHGLFVPPADARALASAIKWLHENREEMPRLGKAARERVLGAYTVLRLAADFCRIYEEVSAN